MDVGPIARSETKISYGRADREFRCSRAVRDRLDMMRAIWGRISGKNRENEKPARSLNEIAYGCTDRKIGPCLPSAARQLYHTNLFLSIGKMHKKIALIKGRFGKFS